MSSALARHEQAPVSRPAPQGAAARLRVVAVTDEASFLDLEPVWDALVEEARLDHPFLRHSWVRTWWECFGYGRSLHVLLVEEAGRPIALAPLMLGDGRMCGLPVRRLESIGNDHTPRFDVVVARRRREAYAAIWTYLAERTDRWDVLQLRGVAAGSESLAELAGHARREGWLIGTWHGETSPFVRFTGTWEEYLEGLSRNHRSKVRKGMNRLERRGRVALEVVASGPGLGRALADGLRIESMGWKGFAGTAIVSDPAVRRFYETCAERAASEGRLRLLFLTLNQVRIAFAYALCDRNRIFVLKAGYDPGYARYSPYNLLCSLVFREAFASGVSQYEFLGGDEPWKLDWTKECRSHDWLLVFPPTPKGRLVHALRFRVLPALRRYRLYRAVRAVVFRRRRAAPGIRGRTMRASNWREFWEQLALSPDPLAAIDGWDLTCGHYRRKSHEIQTLLGAGPGERILNIGCGPGLFETLAVDSVRSWVSLDLAWNMARRARESVGAKERVHMVQANAVRLPFADGSFDRALAHAVTQYLSLAEVGRLLEEAKRVVAPGGRIVIGDITERRPVASAWERLCAVHRSEGIAGLALRVLLRLTAPVRVAARAARWRYLLAAQRLQPAEKPAPISCFSRQELLALAEGAGLAAEVVEKGSGSFYRSRFSLVLRRR